MLKNRTATRERSSYEQLYWRDIECVRLVNNRRFRSSFVANRKGLYQVSTSVLCDCFAITNFFEANFVDVLAPWLFSRETLGANPAVIDVVRRQGTNI